MLHEAGVVHRDIKPGNIMLTADGVQAVLMDLGLAQILDEGHGKVTRTRQFVGTLRYASPEQVLAVERVDRRSDVYSLGATLWELLSLRPIYGSDDLTPPPILMRRIMADEPGRLRSLHRGIARDLEAIVEKCLQKDPGQRYATAEALADDLGRFLDRRPVEARPISEVTRFGRSVAQEPSRFRTPCRPGRHPGHGFRGCHLGAAAGLAPKDNRRRADQGRTGSPRPGLECRATSGE